MKLNTMNTINSVAHSTAFKIKKNSPTILAAAGVVGIATSFVMACKATTKVSEIVEEHEAQIEKAEETLAKCEEQKKTSVYTADDLKRDKTIIFTQTGLKLFKAYAPAVGLAIVSVGCLLGSNYILSKRYAAMSAAYVAVDKSFKEYRSRVAERFGEDIEKQLRYGVKEEEIDVAETDENGKTKVKKQKIEVADPSVENGYVRYFTKGNPYYTGDELHDLNFLSQRQYWANDRLRTRKYLTLNEVYEDLNFAPCKGGLVVGWTFEPNNPDGDNYVQFDIRKTRIPDEFGNYQEAYAIDFNADGNIYKKMA